MRIQMNGCRFAVVLLAAGALAGGCAPKPTTPAPMTAEQKKARGDQLVKAMSDLLAGSQSFTFSTDEIHHRAGPRNQLVERKLTREVAVRRPDAAWFRSQGDRALQFWYAAGQVTLVSDPEKIWARVAVPATLDEAMDDIGDRFGILMPMADLLYSSPWDAYMSAESTGGYVGLEAVGGRQCHHVSYSQPLVDWELWIEDGATPQPCQLAIVYKSESGPPRSTITLRDWNLAATIPTDRFVPAVPEGYERVGIIEKVAPSDQAADSDDTAVALAGADIADTPSAAPAGN